MDTGLFGPSSVAWRVVGHPAAFVGGLRSLIVQSLHPLAMAGVANHSDYKRRPLDRLRRTAHYVAATTFGTRAEAEAAAARVRTVHQKVRGIDVVTGLPYSADDPETQLWVHNVEWHSFLAAYRAYGGKLSRAEQDQYLAEGARSASLLGVPIAMVPQTTAALRAYWERVRPMLTMSDAAREAIGFVLDPPVSFDESIAYQMPVRVSARAALAIVPRHLRRLAELPDVGRLEVASGALVRVGAPFMNLPIVRDAPAVFLGRATHELASRAMRPSRSS